MYFVVGKNEGDMKARFQFSFKYRIFDEDGKLVKKSPWLKNLHFAYTQLSLWNLSASSSPFEDSNYRPSIFWEYKTPPRAKKPSYLRIGYEHESNGQAGSISRSCDMIFAFPVWVINMGDKNLVLGTKIYSYISKGRYNRDIDDYRSLFDFLIRYGNEDGWIANLFWRYGKEKPDTFQLDLSYPIRKKIFSRAGGYFYLQLFYGYGETMLTYNKKEGINFRLGFAIVR